MPDETKVEAQAVAEAAAQAPAKVAEAVAATVETVAKESAKVAKRTRATTQRRVKRQAAAQKNARKTATKATARRTVSKTRKPARKAAVRTAKPVPAKPVVKTASKPARAAFKIVKKETKAMTTKTNKAAETAQFAADQIKTVFGDVNERAKGAMEKTAKVAEELADLTRGNVEAFVASSKLAAKGVEAISQNAAEYSRKSFEDASTALKSFAEVKSATDFFKLQGDFARSAFDAAVAESARVSETVLKLAGEVAEPINSRYSVAAERVKTLAA